MNHPPCGCHVCNKIDPCCPVCEKTCCPSMPECRSKCDCKPQCPPACECRRPPMKPCCPCKSPCECKRECRPKCECRSHCCKHECCPPCKPPKTDSVLLQKIVTCEKRTIPCHCTELSFGDLCGEPPFTLVRVQQSGAQPWWTPLDEPDCRGQLPICVSIPVCAQLCDACGKMHNASAVVDVETALRLPCSSQEFWRHTLLIVPCVRLICAEECSENDVFRVKLHITLEIYLLKPEVFQVRRPEHKCPELPLYPQPVTRPCWPQCQADRALCEWPERD